LGLCPNSLGVGGLSGPNVGENVMKYKLTKLYGLVNKYKLEKIQLLALNNIYWKTLKLLCKNIYLLKYVLKL
jgi:hypothetical protein